MSVGNSRTFVKLKFVRILRLIYGSGSVIKNISKSYDISERSAAHWLSGHIPIYDKLNFVLWAAKVREDMRRHKTEIDEEEQWLNEFLDNPPAWLASGRSVEAASRAHGYSISLASDLADAGCLLDAT